MIIYFVCMAAGGRYKLNLRLFGALAFQTVLGCCMGCALLVPAALSLVQNPRTIDPFNGYGYLVYGSAQQYLAIFYSAFLMPDAPYLKDLFQEGNLKAHQHDRLPAGGGHCGRLVFCRVRRRHPFARIMKVCLICAFVPVLNSMFYALNSSYYARWYYITRWALMRCMRQESLSEHTADTALLAHALCLIARNITHTGADIRPDTVAAAALYHDAPEILTGDMPTPVKYKNEALRTAYKAVERESALAMADLLPPELHEIEGSYLTGSVLNDAERKLLKAADRLSALIKCMEEVESGNREFTAALAQQKADLAAMHSPEADYFIEHMLPCYTQNLDELTKK